MLDIRASCSKYAEVAIETRCGAPGCEADVFFYGTLTSGESRTIYCNMHSRRPLNLGMHGLYVLWSFDRFGGCVIEARCDR